MTWTQLREKFAAAYEPKDLALLDKAYAFSDKYHAGQKRFSGEPYVIHVIETAGILFELHSDPDTLAAALLHDCLEDTTATAEDIRREFGDKLLELVDGVTKISTRVFRDSEERKAENLRKMVLAMAADIRVIIIKLADRLHNMRTLEFLPVDKRLRFARETLEIYAPLAHRLGMGRIKDELEDLAFRHLHVEEFRALVDQVAAFQEQRRQVIVGAQAEIERLLGELDIHARVYGRIKHLYSLWVKMSTQNKDLTQIYDLMALRIIVPNLKDCYAALGIIHSLWKPMPGRFKDFIAMPKTNFYQSLHTSVIGPSGEPLEIQIRTEEMHRLAENGIAAHWSYKEGKDEGEHYESRLAWFRQILEWQRDLHDSQEFLEALKIDLFKDEVFVFTPRGEVKSLPRGSNPIDFAYLIHSRLGDTIVGAKINGRMVPLRYEFKNGDIVEVVTRSDNRPSRDWLNLVKTAKAKNRIRHYFRDLDKNEMEAQGKLLLEHELARCGSTLAEITREDKLLEAARSMNFKTLEQLFIQIGDGNVTARSVAAKVGLTPAATVPQPPASAHKPAYKGGNENGLHLPGIEGVVTRFAQCCHPIAGDPVVGIITKGRGISVHRRDCPNVHALLQESGRLVEVAWDNASAAEQNLEIFVQAQERDGLLSDLLQAFKDVGSQVKNTSTRTTPQKIVNGMYTIQVKGQAHLRDVVLRLEKVKGVLKVSRRASG
ncbi:MAG: bifunctional (p)ppGpp synthetase/guanosine-3',5'-bis(diphosphate) 3'-pyrophosphohydrolase [Candidatus Firestonebacteria bacterium]|nr:bifunctional (p)ppGpp synthetase/guanosine-3',5'-bis(diphosphate) 3'-pyrophosphohydrolase [Candidatus Firestonebacteria bacterium]